MSKIVNLNFSQINPYLRYSHVFETSIYTKVPVKAYEYRLVYVLDGEGDILIDGKTHRVSESTLLLWAPGILYSFHPEDSHPFKLVAFNFDFTMNNSGRSLPIVTDKEMAFNPGNITETVTFDDCPALNSTLCIHSMKHVEKYMLEIDNEYNMRKNYFFQRIKGLLLLLLSDIASAVLVSEASRKGIQKNTVDRVIEYMQEHYRENISNSDIAEYINFDPAYINRLMVKHTGFPLRQYLIRHRISVSLNLLQTTELSVKQISEISGFTDINYFSRVFKKVTGTSPSRYKSGKLNSIK